MLKKQNKRCDSDSTLCTGLLGELCMSSVSVSASPAFPHCTYICVTESQIFVLLGHISSEKCFYVKTSYLTLSFLLLRPVSPSSHL